MRMNTKAMQPERLIDNGEEVTAKTVFDLAKEGDDLALIVYRNFSRYLGIACANIGSILNPSTIVIGGGVSAAGEFLLQGVQKVYDENTFPQVRSTTKIGSCNSRKRCWSYRSSITCIAIR